MSNQQSAGAAWRKVITTKNGEVEILSLVIGDKRYTMWPNTLKKEGEKTPDYRLQEDNYEPKVSSRETATSNQDLPF